MQNTRYFDIDIARVLSMLWIVGIWHVVPYTRALNFTGNVLLYAITETCLGTFFFLSSYLLTRKYVFKNSNAVWQFYKKRWLRFYPLFFIASVLMLVAGGNSLSQTVLGCLGLSSFWGPQQMTLWFMSMLMLFYILTPVLASERHVVSVVSFLLVMLIGWGMQYIFHSVDTRLFIYLPVYYLGIYCGKRRFEIKSDYWYLSVLFYSILLYLVVIVNRSFIVHVASIVGIYTLLSTSKALSTPPHPICSFSGYNSIFYKISNAFSKIVLKIGYASMCVYMFHRFFYRASLFILDSLTSIYKLITIWVVVLPITIVSCFYLQKVYDYMIDKFVK